MCTIFQALQRMTFVRLHMKFSWLLLGLLGRFSTFWLGLEIFFLCWYISDLQWSFLYLLPLVFSFCVSTCIFSIFLFFYFCNHCVNRGLIVPSKEKKKDRKSKLMRKLGRSKSEHVKVQSQRAPGLVGLLEAMRVQMEVI